MLAHKWEYDTEVADARPVLKAKNRRITLIDLECLVELWIEYYRAIDDARRQLLPLRPVHCLNVAT